MTAARPPLMTDEEIAGGAEVFCPSRPDMPLVGERRDVQSSFRSGARFARSIYEAEITKLLDRIAELEGRKFLDQPSNLRGIQHEHDCAAFRVDEVTRYFSGLPCDCGAQIRWCEAASKRIAELEGMVKEDRSELTEFCWLSTSDPDWGDINESKGWERTAVSHVTRDGRFHLFVAIPPIPLPEKGGE